MTWRRIGDVARLYVEKVLPAQSVSGKMSGPDKVLQTPAGPEHTRLKRSTRMSLPESTRFCPPVSPGTKPDGERG